MSDESDDISARSCEDVAALAEVGWRNQLHDLSAIQCRLDDIDARPTAREAVARVLDGLRAMPHSSPVSADVTRALDDLCSQWLQEKAVVSDGLWFQVMEIGSRLADHGSTTIAESIKGTSLLPRGIPTKDASCNRQPQVDFTIRLFDAVVGPAMTATSAGALMETFVAWMARAMANYEFVFLHHVAAPLVNYIQQKHRVLPSPIAEAAERLAERAVNNWQQQAPALTVVTIVLSASSHSSVLRRVHSIVAGAFIKTDVHPHMHRPAAILAVALQVAPLAVASSPLVHQFVLLRTATLSLVYPQLLTSAEDLKRLSERFQESLYRAQLSESDVDTSLRMMDACITEIHAAMASTPAVHWSILHAMRSRPTESNLFRPSLAALYESLESRWASEPVFPAVQFLTAVYDAFAVGIQALHQSPSSTHTLQCFVLLSKLEFARECCSTPERNELMAHMTQRVEDLVESAPNTTLPALAVSLPQQDGKAEDVVFGWAALALGLVVQRKLRTVLFQAAEIARRDAFAIVFAGLYHSLDPLNSFVHRFVGFSLASLGQFVSVYEIFPFYLQETLRNFPSDVSKEQAASVVGTVFGSLYYTNTAPALTEQEMKLEATATETRHAMVLWALRQCSQRCRELLPSQDGNVPMSDGLYLTELFLEIAKMTPVELLPTVAREIEALVHHSSQVSEHVLHEVKTRVYSAISANCEAEKRTWLAAWFLELSAQYPSSASSSLSSIDAAETSQPSPPQPASRL